VGGGHRSLRAGQARISSFFTAAILLVACASAPPQATPLHQPTTQEDLDCKIEGLVYRYLGEYRDDGRASADAIEDVKARLRGLTRTDDEKRSAERALLFSDVAAKYVYALRPLQPTTLMYFGASKCLMIVAGDHHAENAVKLAALSQQCQQQYPPESADSQLKACIVNDSLQLLHQQ